MNAREKELIEKLQRSVRKEKGEERNLTNSFFRELNKTTRNIPITEHDSRNGCCCESKRKEAYVKPVAYAVGNTENKCSCGCECKDKEPERVKVKVHLLDEDGNRLFIDGFITDFNLSSENCLTLNLHVVKNDNGSDKNDFYAGIDVATYEVIPEIQISVIDMTDHKEINKYTLDKNSEVYRVEMFRTDDYVNIEMSITINR